MSRPWQEYCDAANWHEAANIFPLMPDDELQKLADDIKANGLKNPVIPINDRVLDGRNCEPRSATVEKCGRPSLSRS
jgi:hypothetical protein